MNESELIKIVLREGAIGGAVISVVAFLLSRFTRDVAGRGFLAIVLIVAAGAYFGFAVAAGPNAGPKWILLEFAQAVAFGILALLGLRASPYWLALGWALHPVWDIGLHYLGPGRAFAPLPYAIACITFDLVVALYIVVAYRRTGASRLGFRAL
jgi:hypothetical protein